MAVGSHSTRECAVSHYWVKSRYSCLSGVQVQEQGDGRLSKHSPLRHGRTSRIGTYLGTTLTNVATTSSLLSKTLLIISCASHEYVKACSPVIRSRPSACSLPRSRHVQLCVEVIGEFDSHLLRPCTLDYDNSLTIHLLLRSN